MNRIKGIFGLGAAVAAALTLGACSQDETAGGDGALSPMELTATGLEPMVTPMTRATVDGDWSNVTKVAVKVDSEVKEYTVTLSADKKKATLTSTDPFYWPASGGVTVSAWPYNGADMTKPAVVVQSNQSGGGYAASDFIEAVAQSVTKGDPKLVFTHRTAKICVKLTAADGSQLTGAVVSIAVGGQTVEECYNASADGHLALIAPTAAAAELTVKITDTDEKNYVYKHTAVKYDANSQYTFNLKVMNGEAVALSGCTITGWADKLTVNNGEAEEVDYTVDADGTYHVTSAKGLKAWAEAVESSSAVSCVLENDIEMPAVADDESNWTPIRTFRGTFDGNGKTITGLVVNKGTGDNAGFITHNYGTVKNLTLKKAKVTGYSNVGAVAVRNSINGIIENCHVTGASVITGNDNVGGVAGINDDRGTIILACHVAKDCTVSGKEYYVGGIAGENKGSITGCYALCTLTGMNYIGGICGQNNNGLTACYSKCRFEGLFDPIMGGIGGIAGKASNTAAYSACYYANCNYGVGSGTDITDKVTKIGGETTWATACGKMNEALAGTDYQYEDGTTDDEPLVLKEKQQ